MTATDKKIRFSYVIPVYNEEETFALLRESLEKFFAEFPFEGKYEIILVDDGSRDNSWQCIHKFAEENESVVGVRLSRNFGHQHALTAGYHAARGEAVICLDADLQDPLEATLEMIEKWKEGVDIVYAVRSSREGETPFKLWTAEIFYRLFYWVSSVRVPGNSGDFRLVSRRALDAFLQLNEKHRYIRGLIGWVGYTSAIIEYERKPRQFGETKYPLLKMLRLSMDAVVGMSMMPLRLSYFSAFLVAFITLGYLFWTFIKYLFFGGVLVQGWTSLVFLIMFFGFFNLISIGLLGEYVGRTFEEVKNRPNFIISERTDQKEDA